MYDNDLCDDLNASTSAPVAGNGQLKTDKCFFNKASYQKVMGCCAIMTSQHLLQTQQLMMHDRVYLSNLKV